MKIVAIGDTHGKDTWERIVEKEKDADRIIFIGDYFDSFDSFDITAAQQLINFQKIAEFKRKNVEKVVLLLGNHDFHYTKHASGDCYSGFNQEWAREFGLNLQTMLPHMKIVHVEDGYLFSHAGVTETWLEDMKHTVGTINDIDPVALTFYWKDTSRTGNNKHQSPIWVRPEALIPDAVQDYVQVVGHTRQPHISYYEGEHPTRLILIDCLDSVDQYLVVEDGNPRTAEL